LRFFCRKQNGYFDLGHFVKRIFWNPNGFLHILGDSDFVKFWVVQFGELLFFFVFGRFSVGRPNGHCEIFGFVLRETERVFLNFLLTMGWLN
jgi:hypothetical protein